MSNAPQPSTSTEARRVHELLRSSLHGTVPQDRDDADFCDDRFRDYAVRHGVVPSVYRAALDGGPSTRREANVLHASAREAAAAALFQTQVLRELLARFDAAGVPVVVLKGIHLDARYYDGPGRRKDGDHDLLVRTCDLPQAHQIIREAGFAPHEPVPDDASTWPDVYPLLHHAPPFVRPGTPPAIVELHWHVAPSSPTWPVDDAAGVTRAMWKRGTDATLLGRPVRRLQPEDEAVLLALHLVQHLSDHDARLQVRLSMVEDLVRLVRSVPELDRQAIAQRARSLGGVNVLGAPEYLAREVLQAELWPGVAPAWPARHVARRVLSTPVLLNDPSHRRPRYRTRLEGIMAHASVLRRRRDRLVLWRRHVFVSEEHARNATGRSSIFAVPMRWARLAWRLARDAFASTARENA